MKREVCFLIGLRGEILWSDASTSASALPDSRARWEAIWRHRVELFEISHSHPEGPLAFSAEDESTMAALNTALGRKLRFSVVAPNGMIVREGDTDTQQEKEPWWAALLRLSSGLSP